MRVRACVCVCVCGFDPIVDAVFFDFFILLSRFYLFE